MTEPGRRPGGVWRVSPLALVLVVAAFFASAASAATVGQTGGDQTCSAGYVFAQPDYVVPAGGGVLTSFSYQTTGGNAGQQIEFLVLRPTGGSHYAVVGSSGLVTLLGTGLETFPVNIPVQSGDILGFWAPREFTNCVRNTPSAGYIFGRSGQPATGDTLSLTGGPVEGRHLNESANLLTDACGVAAGATHVGSIVVAPGTVCVIDGATVVGSIVVKPGGGLVLTNSTVSSISATGATTFTLCGNRVRGAVSVRQSTGPVVLGSDDGDCGPTVTAPRAAGGNVNSIGGSVSVAANQDGVEVFGNAIGGGLSAVANRGPTAVDIESNHVAGALACGANTPPPTNDGPVNAASVKTGQCALL